MWETPDAIRINISYFGAMLWMTYLESISLIIGAAYVLFTYILCISRKRHPLEELPMAKVFHVAYYLCAELLQNGP